jgi:protocatechuate 4,5-dioxygenase beta chain
VARIIASVNCSHVPAIGAAWDQKKTDTPYWKPIFRGFDFSKQWIADLKPDVVILVYNDHASAFSVELIQDDFDLTIVNKMDVDHGLTVPLSLMFGQPEAWPCRILPLPVNVVQYPPPTGHRCYEFGKAIKRAVESYHEDLRIVIFGTGGMSHQLQGKRAGLINRKFDTAFLDNLVKNPRKVAKIPFLEYVREAGSEAIELVMWLISRGALEDRVREVYRFYHVPCSNTALGHLILENAPRPRGRAKHGKRKGK